MYVVVFRFRAIEGTQGAAEGEGNLGDEHAMVWWRCGHQ